jgi:hypothetical protein
MRRGNLVRFVNDTSGDVRFLTGARVTEKEPGLWHDLTRRWLGVHQPDRLAARDEAGTHVAAFRPTLA